MSTGLISLIVITVLVLWFFSIYNKFVALIEEVRNSEKEISIQLDRRGKIFDSLISSVKKIMDHENNVFTRITELRAQAGTPTPNKGQDKKAVEDELSEIVRSQEFKSAINFTMENYPEIKSNTNMLQLQEEIVSTENKLTFAKKAFNNAIEKYNIKKGKIPDMVVPKVFSNLNKDFEYWSLNEEQIKEQEDKRVNF